MLRCARSRCSVCCVLIRLYPFDRRYAFPGTPPDCALEAVKNSPGEPVEDGLSSPVESICLPMCSGFSLGVPPTGGRERKSFIYNSLHVFVLCKFVIAKGLRANSSLQM